jgi:hypothetical protein
MAAHLSGCLRDGFTNVLLRIKGGKPTQKHVHDCSFCKYERPKPIAIADYLMGQLSPDLTLNLTNVKSKKR